LGCTGVRVFDSFFLTGKTFKKGFQHRDEMKYDTDDGENSQGSGGDHSSRDR
jgi:hypothetical protein